MPRVVGVLTVRMLAVVVLLVAGGDLGGVDAAHLGGEGGRRHPRGRLARYDLLHHLVDLFEREALHLGTKK